MLQWDPFTDNFRMMERFGGRFRSGWPDDADGVSSAAHSPRADQYEEEGNLVIEIELPGVSAIDVAVQVTGESIIVEAERRFVRNGRQVRQLESAYGRMRREFPLPIRAQPDGVLAELKQGFLRITVPRQPANVFHDRTIAPREVEAAHPVEVS